MFDLHFIVFLLDGDKSAAQLFIFGPQLFNSLILSLCSLLHQLVFFLRAHQGFFSLLPHSICNVEIGTQSCEVAVHLLELLCLVLLLDIQRRLLLQEGVVPLIELFDFIPEPLNSVVSLPLNLVNGRLVLAYFVEIFEQRLVLILELLAFFEVLLLELFVLCQRKFKVGLFALKTCNCGVVCLFDESEGVDVLVEIFYHKVLLFDLFVLTLQFGQLFVEAFVF